MNPVKKILCLIDFLQHSDMVGQYAAMLAKTFGAEVEVGTGRVDDGERVDELLVDLRGQVRTRRDGREVRSDDGQRERGDERQHKEAGAAKIHMGLRTDRVYARCARSSIRNARMNKE